jgi:hypothetical protein
LTPNTTPIRPQNPSIYLSSLNSPTLFLSLSLSLSLSSCPFNARLFSVPLRLPSSLSPINGRRLSPFHSLSPDPIFPPKSRHFRRFSPLCSAPSVTSQLLLPLPSQSLSVTPPLSHLRVPPPLKFFLSLTREFADSPYSIHLSPHLLSYFPIPSCQISYESHLTLVAGPLATPYPLPFKIPLRDGSGPPFLPLGYVGCSWVETRFKKIYIYSGKNSTLLNSLVGTRETERKKRGYLEALGEGGIASCAFARKPYLTFIALVLDVSSHTLTGKWFYFCCLPFCVAYVACWFDCDAGGLSAPVHVGFWYILCSCW